MFGVSVVTISLLLHQQLSTIGLLMPSTAVATPTSGSAAKPQTAAAAVDNESRQRNENGIYSDDVDPLLAMESQGDDWRPEDSVRQQHLGDEDTITVGHGQRRYNRPRPVLLNSLLGDSKQQQQQQQSAAAGAWLNGLIKRRAHIFVGKRSRSGASSGPRHMLGIRPEADNDDNEIEDSKRSRMFVGKRPSSSVYFDDDVDDSIDVDDWQSSRPLGGELATADKRSRMFVGKKYAPVFVGKRSADDNQ